MGKIVKGITFLILFLIAAYLFYHFQENLTGQAIQEEEERHREEGILLRVVDGDTIHALINGKDETVRMLGINTHEKGMPYSESGKEFLSNFVNLSIILEKDKEEVDKYQRKLRYIFYNGKNLNLEIIEKGYANVYMISDSKYKQKFLDAEKKARDKEIGIWEKSKEECSECLQLLELNYNLEYFVISNTCSFYCNLTGWFVKDTGRNLFYLQDLNQGENEKVSSEKEVWNNDGDRLFLFDSKGKLVIFYNYGESYT